MKPVLDKLVQRHDLTTDQTMYAIDYAISGDASEAEIAAFLALMAAKGETASEIFGAVQSLKKHMIPVRTPYPVLDIVGTGGDNFNTVNISTAAAIVAAAAGCRVAKHGNRSVTSKSGSADVLEALGVKLLSSPQHIAHCIDQANVGFMYAPHHHPVLKYVSPVRKAMRIRTMFNIIGPLLNPCDAQYAVIGVYNPSLLHVMADALIFAKVKRAVVVHTAGLDEYSNTGVSQVIEIVNGTKQTQSFDPQAQLAMPRVDVSQLKGGDPAENAKIIRGVLAADLEGPIADAIMLNAAVGCYVYGLDPTIPEAMSRVRDVIATKKALYVLDKLVQTSQSAVSPSK